MHIQNAYAVEGFAATDVDILTEREKQCLFYVFLGMTAKQIARYMSISPRTVEEYIEKIKIKYDCDYKQQLIIKALLKGFPIYDFLKTNLKSLTNHLRGEYHADS